MNILIIEDEEVIAARLRRMVKAFFGDSLDSLDHCDSLSDGLEFANTHELDLLLLDLNLNGEDGFDVLKNVLSRSFHNIVVSAYKDRAINAFEYGVTDFVSKPFNEKRLHQALSRTIPNSERDTDKIEMKFLCIQKKGSQHLVELKNLKYIKGARVYSEVYLKDGSKELHNKSLENLLQLLPSNFERIHKSYIVDMQEVEVLKVESGGKYTAILKSGDQLPVSRSKYKSIKDHYLI